MVSDFLVAPARDVWLDALERRFEIVPVIVQDPVWEQSFPDVSGLVVPFVGPHDGLVSLAALNAREVDDLRASNEGRWRKLLDDLRALDLDPVVVSSHEWRDVVTSFLGWADQRLFMRGRA